MKTFFELREKTLTKAELKKREEVAKAIERENPNMPMSKKMAIATATAKKVAEEVKQVKEGPVPGGVPDVVGYLTNTKIIKDKNGKEKRVPANEEVEELDEISKKTLGSYVKKAAGSAIGIGANITAQAMSSKGKADPDDKRQLRNRMTGVSRATDRLTKESVEELDEISRDMARRYIRKVADKTNTGELSTKQVLKRRPGVNLAGKKAYPGIAGEPRVRATESVELDEGIANLSNARLKYHATKNFPHGSYTKAEIENEHKRRLRVEPEYHKAKPSLSEAIDDVSSFGNRKLSSIASSPNHPDRVAAKNELNRRRMRNEEAELGEATVEKWDNVKVNKPGDQYHGHKGVINRSKFGAHTVTFKNGKTSIYDSSELVKEDLDEAKKPKPSNNALVFAKNLEKIKAAIKKEEVELDEVSASTLSKYSVKAASQGMKRVPGQWMADQKVRKKEGKSSVAKVAAGNSKDTR